MKQRRNAWALVVLPALVSVVVVGSQPSELSAQATDRGKAVLRDGSRDFDFEFGRWSTHLRRLVAPLTGSNEWVEYEGTSVVSPVLAGRANLVELDVAGPAGRIEGLSLRLYEPETGQWSLNFSNVRTGRLSAPVVGHFADGRGEFYGQERIGGRTVLVRFVISDITPTSARFEQAFSDDGGQRWEVNWIAVDTKIEAGSGR